MRLWICDLTIQTRKMTSFSLNLWPCVGGRRIASGKLVVSDVRTQTSRLVCTNTEERLGVHACAVRHRASWASSPPRAATESVLSRSYPLHAVCMPSHVPPMIRLESQSRSAVWQNDLAIIEATSFRFASGIFLWFPNQIRMGNMWKLLFLGFPFPLHIWPYFSSLIVSLQNG